MSVIAYHFWSPTCNPCKVIKPAIDDLKEEFSVVTWVPVNTHDDPAGLAAKYCVKFVPTIVVIVNDADGNEVSAEPHTGTNIMGYYRILRNATKKLSLM
jgi:thiol-disulfide isomerase/thioredoxin